MKVRFIYREIKASVLSLIFILSVIAFTGLGLVAQTAGTGAPCLFPTRQKRAGTRFQPFAWPRGGTLGASRAEIKESRGICLTESLFLQRSLVFLQSSR